MQVDVTWDRGQLKMWEGQNVERAIGRALTKAGRDGLRSMRTESSRVVRARKRIKLAFVNSSLPTSSRGAASDINSLEWRMDVSGVAIPVVDYPHAQTRKGVTVAINKGRRVLIRSAFEAKMRSGHVGVFVRTGKGRLPIRELYTTRVSDVFADAGMIPSVLASGLSAFDRTFDRVFPIELDRLK